MKCKTKTKREKNESKVGCRYSILLELPYFDPLKMLIIDPMHNLYLGTATTIFRKGWMQQLSKAAIASINQRVSNLVALVTVRFSYIPSPIEYSLTAEQWMLWVNYYSIYCMHGIISDEELECWRPFVLASRLLSSSCVSKENIRLADALLLLFCSRFECIYGSQAVKPNMHILRHSTECQGLRPTLIILVLLF